VEREVVHILIAVNLVVSIAFFMKRKCEIPFFLALFNLLVEYRTVSIKSGLSEWVNINYEIYFKFNLDYAYIVSDLIFLGSTVLIYSFIFFFRYPKNKVEDSNNTLEYFVQSKRKIILIGLVLFTFFQIVVSGEISHSYGLLSKLGNTSFIILLFLLFVSSKDKSLGVKALFLFMFILLGYITYSPALRFQFLGWMIPIGYYLVRRINPLPKVLLLFTGLYLILIVFSAAGVLRYKTMDEMTVGELYQYSYNRMKVADDVNFIDGFVMLHQIYPKHLDYTYGQEHLNIFLRPIPRSIWPDKPYASWLQNYYAKHGKKGVWSAGFSPTLYGTFYSEMGIEGIVVFSILWAILLSYIYRSISKFDSDIKVILIGILLASMIPIFRSGDLAGDFAIVLMSYWPFLLFVRYYKIFLKQRIENE
jgi:hypothetical protein